MTFSGGRATCSAANRSIHDRRTRGGPGPARGPERGIPGPEAGQRPADGRGRAEGGTGAAAHAPDFGRRGTGPRDRALRGAAARDRRAGGAGAGARRLPGGGRRAGRLRQADDESERVDPRRHQERVREPDHHAGLMRGLFIAFEGIEGAGKSTQVALLAERLKAHGQEPLLVREPGGTELGEEARRLVLHGSEMSPAAELFLYLLARAELVTRVIRPALEAGRALLPPPPTLST